MESPEQGETPTFHIVIPLCIKESNDKLLLWMTWITNLLWLKEEAQGAEGSEEAVQMAKLWTQVLDDQ